MELVNYKLLADVSKQQVKSEVKQEEITERLENLSNNANIKYLNFKVIGGALGLGLVLGALSVLGYTYYALSSFKKENTDYKVIVKNQERLKDLEKENKDLKVIVHNRNLMIEQNNKDIATYKDKISALKSEISTLEDKNTVLSSKVLPKSYYCSDDSGKQYICVKDDDERLKVKHKYSDDGYMNYETYYYIELK